MYNNTTQLFLIHGLWSTKNTFNYLERYLYNNIHFQYDSNNTSLTSIVNDAKLQLDSIKTPVVLVGHSMGGLIALSLEDHPMVSQVITVASPLSGIKYNKLVEAYYMFNAPILQDVGRHSIFMRNLHLKNYTKPIHCITATRGFNPMLFEPNDNVLTVESQESWMPENAKTLRIDANHHEIVQTREFVEYVGNIQWNGWKLST